MRNALVMLKKQTGFSVVFPYGLIDLDKQVKVEVQSASINVAMNQLLLGQEDIAYHIKGNIIILHRDTDRKNEKLYRQRVDLTKDSTWLGLDEVVVIGYSSVRKSDLTGAVSSVDINMTNHSTISTEAMIRGMAPGVYVSQGNGAPGALPFMYIRGLATVNNQCTPLYVVDGVQVGSDISFLNPSDVEHIEILKDASATAIYGAQAANGVVNITLKHGSPGTLGIFAETQMGVAWNPHYYKMLDVDQYAAAIRTARSNDGNVLVMPVWKTDYDKQRVTTDWQDVMMRTTFVRKTQVRASGGTDNLQGCVSLGWLQHPGIVECSEYDRLALHTHVSGKAGPNMTFSGSVNATRTHNTLLTSNIMKYCAMPPTMDYTDDEGRLVHPSVINSDGTYGTFWQYSGRSELSPSIDNLLARRRENEVSTTRNYLFSYLEADLNLLPPLHWKTNLAFVFDQTDENVYYATRKRYNPVYSETEDSWSLQPIALANSVTSSSLTFTKSNGYAKALESYMTYSRHFSSSSLTALAGMTLLSSDANYSIASAGSFPFDNIRDLGQSVDRSTNRAAGLYKTCSRKLSYYTRLICNLNNRYNVTASLRRDGSSHFSRSQRWGTFPSFAVAWRLTGEPWFRHRNWLDDLKIRLGWGVTGNSGMPNELNIPQLTVDNVKYKFYTEGSGSGTAITYSGSALADIVDPDLRWESNTQMNIGLDATLLQHRLVLSADFYVRTTSDLLVTKPLRYSTGFQTIYTNAGKVRNVGFELSARYRQTLRQFSYDVQTTATMLSNRVLQGTAPMFFNYNANQGMHWGSITVCQPGYALGSWYGYRTDGLFRSEQEIDQANAIAQAHGKEAYQANAQPGDIRFVDINGDGTITEEDRTVIGNGYSQLTLGMNISLRYRGFDFLANIHGELGRSILSYSAMSMSLMTSSDSYVPNMLRSEYEKHWSADNPGGTLPRLSINDPNWNMRCSDFWIRNGNYAKLDNLQIGYTYHARISSLLEKAISSFRIYINMSNVFCLSPYNKYGSPELGGSLLFQGIDDGNYPVARSACVGLQIWF